MNKAEFITLLSEKLNTTKVEASNVLDGVLKTIVHAMKTNDELRFIGFGTFKTRKTKARMVTTPRGQTVKVPTGRQIKFSAGTEFKKAINTK